MTALAFAAWDGGHVADAVVMLRGAALRGDRSPSETAAVFPQLRLAAALTALGDLDEAAYAIDEAQARIDRRGATLWSAGPAVRRAALHLAAGRLDDASAEADTALALCAERSTGFFVSAAEAVLGDVALQRGDIRTAADHLVRQQVATTGNRSAVGPGQSGWAAARLAQAAGDDARLGTAVEALFEQGRRHRRLFVDEPGAGAWLTRVLLDIDHNARHRAEVVVLGVEQLAGDNPGARSLEASADHARGVLDGDLTRLERAAERYRHPWAAAAALEDAGEVLHRRGDHDDVRLRVGGGARRLPGGGCRWRRPAAPGEVEPAREVPPAGEAPLGLAEPDRDRAPRRRRRCRGAHQRRGRGVPVRLPPHRRLPPAPHLRQAGDPITGRARSRRPPARRTPRALTVRTPRPARSRPRRRATSAARRPAPLPSAGR